MTNLPLFWDLITGGAPVNEYSILGYNMLITAYFSFFLSGVIFVKALIEIYIAIEGLRKSAIQNKEIRYDGGNP